MHSLQNPHKSPINPYIILINPYKSHITTVGTKYIPYSYMEHLGDLLCGSLPAGLRWPVASCLVIELSWEFSGFRDPKP